MTLEKAEAALKIKLEQAINQFQLDQNRKVIEIGIFADSTLDTFHIKIFHESK